MSKTWGPFTGRQLTVMICTLMALIVLIPGTVYAVASFTNVAIEDPSSGARAKVINHAVKVGDGAGALTVDGSVTGRDAAPADLVHFIGAGGATNCQVVATPPAGKAWVLKSLAVNIVSDGGTAFGPSEYVVVYNNSTCSYPYFAVMTPAQVGREEFVLDPGVTVPGNGAVSVALFNSTANWELTGQGYSVPASSVPAAPAQARTRVGAHRHSPDS